METISRARPFLNQVLTATILVLAITSGILFGYSMLLTRKIGRTQIVLNSVHIKYLEATKVMERYLGSLTSYSYEIDSFSDDLDNLFYFTHVLAASSWYTVIEAVYELLSSTSKEESYVGTYGLLQRTKGGFEIYLKFHSEFPKLRFYKDHAELVEKFVTSYPKTVEKFQSKILELSNITK